MNYKSAVEKVVNVDILNNNNNNNKKKEDENKNKRDKKNSYDKNYLNELIDDEFNNTYSSEIIDAKMDFEDFIYEDYGLKLNETSKSKSFASIIKYHSAKYYRIKQDIHKNKSQYL